MARWFVAGLFGLVSLGLLPGVALAEGCPNEQFRTGLSAGLADCRAYEMVSPVDKNEGGVSFQTAGLELESSVDGSRMEYASPQAFAGAPSGGSTAEYYLAARGVGGWSSQALLPPEATSSSEVPNPLITAFSPDLSTAVLEIGGGGRGQDSPPLVSGEPAENQNLFVRDIGSGSYRLVDVTPPGVIPAEANFAGASSDLSRVVFEERAKLTGNAAGEGKPNLYEWSGGVLSLVSVLPGGGPLVTEGGVGVRNVSEDGSRVVFESSGQGETSLYLYEGGVTVQVDASRGPGLGGHGKFQVASGDGSRVFFLDEAGNGLTNDTVPGSGLNLYEYDVAGGRLIDLTPVAQAEVYENVVGASRDGSYVYFVANGGLATGATVGQPNLYEWHEGTMRLIATLAPGNSGVGAAGDSSDWDPQFRGLGGGLTVKVTPDGLHVAFESIRSLTGYDNTDANTGLPDSEVFLYDVLSGRLVCASCNPSGARPVGSSLLSQLSGETGTSLGGYFPRYLSADGSRLFFNSFDALVPGDVNGKEDVYVYEGGQVHLISTGTSGEDSQFADASASGGDVFFTTAQRLVSQDRDYAFDLYDARVGGGFPPVAAGASCGGEDCRQGASGSLALGVPGSATFSGVGNVVPAPAVSSVKTKKAKKPRAKRKRRKRAKGKRRARVARRGVRGHSTGKQG